MWNSRCHEVTGACGVREGAGGGGKGGNDGETSEGCRGVEGHIAN